MGGYFRREGIGLAAGNRVQKDKLVEKEAVYGRALGECYEKE